MHRPVRPGLLWVCAAVCLLVITSCATPTGSRGSSQAAGTGGPVKISVVTSTNVYAAIAAAIGGDRVQTTAILSNPAADPHSFEVSAQDQVTIAKADLVIANGGGYDDFAQQMVDAAKPAPRLLDAVKISGLQTAGDNQFNEHVFYNLAAMSKLGSAIADNLSALDPARRAGFEKNAAGFASALSGLQRTAAAIGSAHPNVKAVVTEPVADYLLASAGIKDVTPQGFSSAIEQENDPAPGDIAQVDQLLEGKTVGLVAFNAQTAGPVTERLKKKARELAIPVLNVTETLPAGVTSYPDWISGTLDRLSTALK